MFMRKVFCGLILIILPFFAFSQKDKEFWFAAPYVSEEHGNLPIYLKFSTYDEPATIYVDIPANQSFKPITRNLGAYESFSLDLSRYEDLIVNSRYNSNLNRGLHITATTDISAYYEVVGYSDNNEAVNSDIFSLKGSNALGKQFLLPYQISRPNENNFLTDAYSAFYIVATENNTQVTITPTKDLYGHPKGESFNITLNKGETYALQSKRKMAVDRPSGTVVSSNKPIAITISDDSVLENSSYDLIGDQMVPVENTGKEYIIPEMHVNSIQTAYILATENETEVFSGFDNTIIATLDKGETIEVSVHPNGTYISSNKNIYVWHISSQNDELGAALLPGIECNGSRSVVFRRNSLEDFGLAIIAPTNSIDNFLFDGLPDFINPEDFKPVDGTNDYQVFFKFFSLDSVGIDKVHRITNTSQDFQLGIISANGYTTFRYGYFSSFTLINLGPDVEFCVGGKAVFDAGPDKDNYLWNTGDTTRKVEFDSSGTYSVQVSRNGCMASDTVKVLVHPLPEFSLGNDTSICKNEEVSISGPDGPYKYLWNGLVNKKSLNVKNGGTYTLKVTDQYGCSYIDSKSVELLPLPSPSIYFQNEDKILCQQSTITISTGLYPKILWENGDTNQIRLAETNKVYTVKVEDENGCEGFAQKELDCSPFISYYDLITPNNDGKNEFFILNGPHNQKYTLEVYNRWGERIYKKQNYNNELNPISWSEGVYYFNLTHQIKDLQYSGWFTLIK